MRPRGELRSPGRLLPALMVASAILGVTLTPSGGGGTPSPFCVLCGGNGGADLVLNVVLFAPFGAALAWVGTSAKRATVASLLLSGAIEATQIVLPNRSPTVRDIASNAFGGGTGAAAVWALPRLALAPMPAGVVGAAVALPAAVVWATRALLGPSLRSVERLDAIWEPQFARPGNRWSGTLLSVDLDGRHLPNAAVRVDPQLRRAIASGRPLTLRIVAGDSTARYMPIVRLAPEVDESLLLVAQADRGVIVFSRRAASDLRLRTPGAAFPRALEGVRPGDTLQLAVEAWSGTSPCLRVRELRHCAAAPHAGRAWSFLLPPGRLPTWVADAVTLGVLFAPLAFLLGLGAVRQRRRLLVVGAVVALLVVARWLGFAAFTGLDAAIAASIGALAWRLGALARVRAGEVALTP